MLTETQQRFLDTLEPSVLKRIVMVEPWDSRGLALANRIIADIKNLLPESEVQLTGSMFFQIAGEKDIDITIYCPKAEQAKYAEILKGLFGQPTSSGKSHIGWAFDKENFHITIFISDPASPNTQVQTQLFELLKQRPDLVKEYEEIKLQNSGKTYKDYQIAKYEFFNKILIAGGMNP